MFTPLVFPTSLEFWMTHDKFSFKYISYSEILANDQSPGLNLRSFSDRLSILGLSTPIHVMVPREELRQKCNHSFCHTAPKHLPPGSLVELSDRLYISSPEYCVLEAAGKYSLPILVCIICDLCGLYYFNRNAQFGQSNREPITSVEKISSYLEGAVNIKGVKKARQAIRYALNGSNSPMESKIATFSCLPASLGGYALCKPCLNQPVKLSKKAAAIFGRDTCRGDMVWEFLKKIVEYDSNMTHLNTDQHHYDKKRANAFAESGYSLTVITRDDFRSLNHLDLLFFSIRSDLSLRTHKSRFSKYSDTRSKTINTLLRFQYPFTGDH